MDDDDAYDWSLLPHDLLRQLGEKLQLPHRIVFRTVCKSWCLALPPIVIPCPWLLLPAERIDDSCTFLPLPSDNEHYSFFKFSPVPSLAPPLHGMCYAGSNDGWVAIVDLTFNISLLNPLTGVQIDLPSLLDLFPCETLPNCGGYIFHDKKVGNSYFNDFETCRDYHLKKVIFSSNPTPSNYMAMVIFNGFPCAYTKAGTSKWINLDFSMRDIIYYNGLFYALIGPSEIVTIDLSGDDPIKRFIIEGDIEFSDSFVSLVRRHHEHYIALSSTGELFLILRRTDYVFLDPSDDDPIKHETIGFMVFKYNCESNSYWDEVRCLGNKSIFIGMNNAYLLSIEDFAGLKANCIYFTDTWEGSRCNADIGKSNLDIGFFDLEQEKFKRCCLPYEIMLPPPIWFMPSLDRVTCTKD
ncbi:hypothetical protein ZIOFF_048568 [Zingiber officinale]|uniref:KIB1-4 beta-propeller domain-containing protein n=1 Tax=Zingiber officinale TaxID=94328 RepID=A0A8J5KMT5_ZINOF|nr:hypothetical protein ZIOFF_048568 [Zingiber officinale]